MQFSLHHRVHIFIRGVLNHGVSGVVFGVLDRIQKRVHEGGKAAVDLPHIVHNHIRGRFRLLIEQIKVVGNVMQGVVESVRLSVRFGADIPETQLLLSVQIGQQRFRVPQRFGQFVGGAGRVVQHLFPIAGDIAQRVVQSSLCPVQIPVDSLSIPCPIRVFPAVQHELEAVDHAVDGFSHLLALFLCRQKPYRRADGAKLLQA